MKRAKASLSIEARVLVSAFCSVSTVPTHHLEPWDWPQPLCHIELIRTFRRAIS